MEDRELSEQAESRESVQPESRERMPAENQERMPAENAKKTNKKNSGAIFVILAGIFWGTTGIFVRYLNEAGLHSMQLVEMRAVFSAIFAGIIVFFYNRSLLKFRLKDWWCFAGTGIAGTVIFNACYFATIERVSLAVAATLMYTAPIFVTLFSVVLFKEKLTVKKVICLALACAGCALVSGIASSKPVMDFAGFAIGMLSGLGYGFYTIFARFALNRGYSSLTLLVYTYVFAGVAGIFLTDFGPVFKALGSGNPMIWLAMLGVVVITTIAPNLCYFKGLPQMETGKAAVLASTEPVTAALIGVVLFSEVPTLLSGIGMLLVIVALTWLNVEPSKPEQDIVE